MADIEAFRDYQAQSAVLLERERALEERRRVVQELRHAAQTLRVENATREEQLEAERCRFNQKKAIQDEKIAVKQAFIADQQNRLDNLAAEESMLINSVKEYENEINNATAELDRLAALEEAVRCASAQMAEINKEVEERDSAIMRLETRIARQEMVTDKRHAAVAERVGEHVSLPVITDHEKAYSAEDTAGESVLLVEDESHC